ncbi:MAG: hypothetical protein KBT39_07800, partial [Bacteroidales bacterium]|nr:hypothetical protein [Bacteroidales bacterium]
MATLAITYYLQTAHIYTSRTGHPGTHVYICNLPIKQLLSLTEDIESQHLNWRNTIQAAEQTFELSTSINEKQEEHEAETARIINEIHERITYLQQKGMSLRTLRQALLKYQTPSHITITADCSIILTDLNNLEIPLTPLCKTIYLLFLHHPEGIFLKQIDNYRNELITLYEKCAPTLNPTRRITQIASITNPLSNSLNEKISIIRHCLTQHLDDNLLPYYTITGRKSEAYSIHLPH